MTRFDTIESAISDIASGKMVIVVDNEDRENEGDLLMAAEMVTPEAINFMVSMGRGLVCAPITSQRAQELELDLMVKNSPVDTAFTVSVDCIDGGTGVSCFDRAKTIKTLIAEETIPSDLARPGHIFPLIARDGGVLERPGHTEAAVDLAILAGLAPVGVLCEVLEDDGSTACRDYLFDLSTKLKIKIITIKDLIDYKMVFRKKPVWDLDDFATSSGVP